MLGFLFDNLEEVLPEGDFGGVAVVGETKGRKGGRQGRREGGREGGSDGALNKPERRRKGGREGGRGCTYRSIRSHIRSMAQDSAWAMPWMERATPFLGSLGVGVVEEEEEEGEEGGGGRAVHEGGIDM